MPDNAEQPKFGNEGRYRGFLAGIKELYNRRTPEQHNQNRDALTEQQVQEMRTGQVNHFRAENGDNASTAQLADATQTSETTQKPETGEVAGFTTELKQIVESLRNREGGGWELASVSHETWAAVSQYYGDQGKDYSPIDKQPDSKQGSNAANVFVGADMLDQRLRHEQDAQAFVGEMKAWSKEPTTAENILAKVNKNPAMKKLIFDYAVFMHNSYAYAEGEYHRLWESFTTDHETRMKSYIVSIALVDNMVRRLVGKTDTTVNTATFNLTDKSVIEKIVETDIPLESSSTRNGRIWDKGREVQFNVDPAATETEQKLWDRMKKALMSPDPLLNGGKPVGITEAEADAHLNTLKQRGGVDVLNFAADKINTSWAATQVDNPLRLTCLYKDKEEIGKRRKVAFIELHVSTQESLLQTWSPEFVAKQAEKVIKGKIAKENAGISADDLAAKVQAEMEGKDTRTLAQNLTVELDPRIAPYNTLNDKDKGNNIAGVAGTLDYVETEVISANPNATRQEIVDMISEVIVRNLQNPDGSGTLDNSHPLTEKLAALMHDTWAINALNRDGLAVFKDDSTRKTQLQFFAELPNVHNGTAQDRWQDEQQYDRDAVAKSLMSILIAFAGACNREQTPKKVTLSPAVLEILVRNGYPIPDVSSSGPVQEPPAPAAPAPELPAAPAVPSEAVATPEPVGNPFIQPIPAA
jgi:hypothetical protein